MPGVGMLGFTHFDWGEQKQKLVDYDMAVYIEKIMAEKLSKTRVNGEI